MVQEVILNGRTSNIAPDNALVINRPARFEPPIINGLMQTDISINGLARPPVLNGCVLYLPLYHSALSNPDSFKSLDAYQHTCSVTGALWRPNGRAFDGDDKINCGNAESLNLLSAVTLDLWLKAPFSTGTKILVAKDHDSEGRAWALSIESSGYLDFWGGGGVGMTPSNTKYGNDVWTHIMAVYISGTSLTYYVNGVAAGQDTSVPDMVSTTTEVMIGARSYTGSPLYLESGIIGEVRIYGRALSPLEIQRIYLLTKWRYQ